MKLTLETILNKKVTNALKFSFHLTNYPCGNEEATILSSCFYVSWFFWCEEKPFGLQSNFCQYRKKPMINKVCLIGISVAC